MDNIKSFDNADPFQKCREPKLQSAEAKVKNYFQLFALLKYFRVVQKINIRKNTHNENKPSPLSMNFMFV